ncbi:hypothetical protein DP939_04730 [Spongiactinospora rosea]|uniref:DUF2637 domain-containing protein n=1 Tax=Spongiactinospora rosea TaxID=2248750 RepID=A0A366M7G5_9ACTN|nr:hypothetical protein [Spongiactinospora rosea]RBQ21977.1 hypothetical protein DP939_04730 [Spongiactinospora rosea]
MDVTPPAAGPPAVHPHAFTEQSSPDPAARPAERAGRARLTLRHVAIALAGACVVALGAVACVLSFDELRALAVVGRARPDLAYLYPAGFDALLAVALISVLLLRTGRTVVRVQAGAVLVLLLVAAGAAEVAAAVGAIDVRQAVPAPTGTLTPDGPIGMVIGVAVAPWVMLTVALWLWLLMIKHAGTRREALASHTGAEDDIVPFRPPNRAEPEPEPEPEPESQPTPERAPEHTAEDTAEPERAPELPKRLPGASPMPKPRIGLDDEEEEEAAEVAQEPARPPVPEERAPDMPLRWGDLAKTLPRKRPGDVLVHPRPSQDQDDTGQDTDEGPDTQPLRVFSDEPPKARGHADGTGETEAGDSGPPSGRVRSTPTPPEE